MIHHWFTVPTDATPEQWDTYLAEDERLARLVKQGNTPVWFCPFEDEIRNRTRILIVFRPPPPKQSLPVRAGLALWFVIGGLWVVSLILDIAGKVGWYG